MIIKNVNELVPEKDMVLVKVVNLEKIYTDLAVIKQSTEDDIVTVYGEVISIGPEVDSKSHCEGLSVGDFAAFSQFAGFHVVTEGNEMCKLIRGYDIVGMYKNMEDIANHNALPASNRVLVEEFQAGEGSDLIMGTTGTDPRLADLAFGVITGVGPSVKNKDFKVGVTVGYAPYVGTTISEYESEDSKALKIIVEEDVLVTY